MLLKVKSNGAYVVPAERFIEIWGAEAFDATTTPWLCLRLAALGVFIGLASQSFIQFNETLLIRPSLIAEIATEGAKRARRQSHERKACIVRDG
jgi:hypothetical protein